MCDLDQAPHLLLAVVLLDLGMVCIVVVVVVVVVVVLTLVGGGGRLSGDFVHNKGEPFPDTFQKGFLDAKNNIT